MTPAKKKSSGSRSMSAQHKAALATGRSESAAVRAYLDALQSTKRKPGRQRTPDSINKRLAAIEKELVGAKSLKQLSLRQEASDLKAELGTLGKKTDISALESAFVKSAKVYGARKGISYGTWRSVGVSAEVLGKAGITRGR